jgi:hypothetical protein
MMRSFQNVVTRRISVPKIRAGLVLLVGVCLLHVFTVVEAASWQGIPGTVIFENDDLTNNHNANNLVEQVATVPSNGLLVNDIHRGGGLIPAGYNPFGYKITPLGQAFLEFDGSLE